MFNFENLDQKTRQYMLLEAQEAIRTSQLNYSKRFTKQGIERYPQLLLEAIQNGNEQTLAAALKQQECFNSHEKQGAVTLKVPDNAQLIFAEGEFNNFYMRGVCHRAFGEGLMVEIYRAKAVATPRSASKLIEGNLEDPRRVLLLIKNSLDGSKRGGGMPAGSNSGLSVRLTTVPVH